MGYKIPKTQIVSQLFTVLETLRPDFAVHCQKYSLRQLHLNVVYNYSPLDFSSRKTQCFCNGTIFIHG